MTFEQLHGEILSQTKLLLAAGSKPRFVYLGEDAAKAVHEWIQEKCAAGRYRELEAIEYKGREFVLCGLIVRPMKLPGVIVSRVECYLV